MANGLQQFAFRLRTLDRRWVFLLLAAVLALPFFVPYRLPVEPSDETRAFFQTVERIADDAHARDKVVLLFSNWGFGTEGENRPQMYAVVRHLIRRRLKFAVTSVTMDPVIIEAAQVSVEDCLRIERERAESRGGLFEPYVYGVDWINLGFKPAPAFNMVARGMAEDIPAFAARDYVRKQALTPATFPIMQHLKSAADVELMAIVSAGDEARDAVGIIQSRYPAMKIVTATLGIVAIELYPFVRSGQLSGLIDSAGGAREYAALLDPDEREADPLPNAMGLAKVLLVALVLLGNAAHLVSRRRGGDLKSETADAAPDKAGRARFGVVSAGLALVCGGCVLIGFVRLLVAAPRLTAPQLESQLGQWLGIVLTLGVFSFLLGANAFYRVIEHVLVGAGSAYLAFQLWDEVFLPKWIEPVTAGVRSLFDDEPGVRWSQLLWVLAVVPGSLWYFTYSTRHLWLNRLLIAAFVGLAVGPEFGRQIGLLVPQVADTLKPVVIHDAAGWHVDRDHLVFLIVMLTSLLYFIFFLSPRARIARPVLSVGRVSIMIGMGALFGSIVNTRIAWLAPRIEFLVRDGIGMIAGW